VTLSNWKAINIAGGVALGLTGFSSRRKEVPELWESVQLLAALPLLTNTRLDYRFVALF